MSSNPEEFDHRPSAGRSRASLRLTGTVCNVRAKCGFVHSLTNPDGGQYIFQKLVFGYNVREDAFHFFGYIVHQGEAQPRANLCGCFVPSSFQYAEGKQEPHVLADCGDMHTRILRDIRKWRQLSDAGVPLDSFEYLVERRPRQLEARILIVGTCHLGPPEAATYSNCIARRRNKKVMHWNDSYARLRYCTTSGLCLLCTALYRRRSHTKLK